MPEALEAMRRGEVYAIFHIPSACRRVRDRHVSPSSTIIPNSAYLMAGSFTFRDMKMLSELASAKVGLQTGQARVRRMEEIMATVQPIVVRNEVMSNPWLNYSAYLTTTILPGILQLMILLLTSYSIGLEIKRGTASEWASSG